MWRNVAVISLCIAFYFSASISLTVFNKWFFSEKPAQTLLNSTTSTASGISHGDRYSSQQFHFPLTVTCIHQAIVFILVLATEKNFLRCSVGPIERSRSTLAVVAPIGVASGLDWGLSNTSLRWIPLTMYEMVKCSAPIVVLLLGWWIGVQQLTPRMLGIVAVLTFGIFLSVSGGNVAVFSSADFPFQGFVCVSLATLLAGIRVVFAQRVLHGDRLSSSVNTATFLYYVTPTSCGALLLPAYIFEGPQVVRYLNTHSVGECVWLAFLVFMSSCLAYFLSLSEYVLTQKTSALSLSVCGIAKQALITALAMMVFHEKIGGTNIIGVLLCFAGIAAYNLTKYQQISQYTPVPFDEEEMPDRTQQAPETADDVAFSRKNEKYSF